ncbi:hypothetical protein [Pseudonocardia acaciae]|uniref:hypothetical protein n=1 Tax=Pseudonocardia acaciae TaxID=551276 RepID=UPI00048B0D02|nr:hypothetical protein [Pseudonocardia acaciae]
MTRMMTGLDRDLLRAAERRNPARLATAAHEMGHALAALDAGITVDHVRLKFGMFGGLHGGQCECDWDEFEPDPTWSRGRKIGQLLFHLAGHAAETRFRRLYLNQNPRQAYRAGKDDATNDYWHFRNDRKRLRLRGISEDWAFDQATTLLENQSTRLDRLTLRLERDHRVPGRHL